VPGAPEPLYVLARRVLLDALEALGDQRAAVIVIGAQAIYLLTGEADIAVAPFTTDGDLALVPELLQDEPQLARALETAGFTRTRETGARELGLLSYQRQQMVPRQVVELIDRVFRTGIRDEQPENPGLTLEHNHAAHVARHRRPGQPDPV
jgi:hypothetical protein